MGVKAYLEMRDGPFHRLVVRSLWHRDVSAPERVQKMRLAEREGVAQACNFSTLCCQTFLKVRIDAKGLFGALSNRDD
jgi:hypothetical protein